MGVSSVRYTPYECLLGGGHVHQLCGGQAALVVLVALHALVQVHSERGGGVKIERGKSLRESERQKTIDTDI
jgi:hypothetical protein